MKISDTIINILVVLGIGGVIIAGFTYSIISDSEYAMTISFFGTILSAVLLMMIIDIKARA